MQEQLQAMAVQWTDSLQCRSNCRRWPWIACTDSASPASGRGRRAAAG